jgi:methyl-accepting chemotaxis protein
MDHPSATLSTRIKRFITGSMRNRGVAALSLPLVIIVTFVSLYYPSRQKSLSLQSTETQVRTLSEMLAFSVGAGLHDSNFDLVQTAFNWVKKDQQVEYTAIIDESESVLFEHNPNMLKVDYKTVTKFRYDEENTNFQTSLPIEYKGKIFGRIVMVYSLRGVIADIRGGLITSILVGLVIFVIGVVFILLIFQKLSQSIIRLRDAARRASEGYLDVAIDNHSVDEIGELTAAFNKMVQNISDLIRGVSKASAAVSNASSEISSSTEEMAAGTQEQSSQTSNVAAAVEEMARTLSENNSNIRKAAEGAGRAQTDATQGGRVVQQTIDGMHRIAEVVSHSAQKVKILGSSSDRIGEIIGVIDDIADQTNLLALNAAIEAARAGDQGRGFAVVADEVRKLAERTSKATKEIATMIRQIQSDTTDAVTAMEQGTSEVDKGISLAEKAGEVLRGIVGMAQSVADMMTQIASASAEQSSAADEISKNVDSISTVTQQTAGGTQQIARSSEDLNKLTMNLEEMINKFRLDSHPHQTSMAGGDKHFGSPAGPRKAITENGRLVEYV